VFVGSGSGTVVDEVHAAGGGVLTFASAGTGTATIAASSGGQLTFAAIAFGVVPSIYRYTMRNRSAA
jgi:hypothetical protein